jgi:phosphatidylserine/phosphatidylglycerophosphate/cardiolipin synthase-like enzyme
MITQKAIWLRLIFSIFFSLFLASPAGAVSYDWVPVDREDIQMTERSQVLIQFRLELIRHARETLDLVTFDQRVDPVVGLPMLDAIEDAAKRGVKVRYIVSQMLTPFVDPLGRVDHRLKHIASLYKNFQYIWVGGLSMAVGRGWKLMDGIHEKLVVIDRTWGITTGAGHSDQYMNWLDTGFFIKGALVAQSAQAFDRLWKSVLRENVLAPAPIATPSVSLGQAHASSLPEPLAESSEEMAQVKHFFEANDVVLPPAEAEAGVTLLSEEEFAEFKNLVQWMNEPSRGGVDFRGRILHFDFLDQLRTLADQSVRGGLCCKVKKSPGSFSLESRLTLLKDPVVAEVIEQLKTARSFKMTTFATILHPEVRRQLIARLTGEMPLEIFTNSRESHRSIHRMGVNIGWVDSLPDLDSLLAFPSAKAFLLVQSAPHHPHFLHRKLLVLNQDPSLAGGRESSVIFGSHNLTFASSTTLDEMSFQVEGAEFADRVSSLVETGLTRFARPLSRDEAAEERRSTWWDHLLVENLKWLF